MNRIDHTFSTLKAEQRKALVGFFTVGYPDFDTSLEIIQAACRAGVDVVELGVPFSDPTADGPIIQATSSAALKSGMTLTRSLEFARRLRATTETAIVLFSYYNLIFKYGLAAFLRDATDAGVDGLLIVDLPPEESTPLLEAAQVINAQRASPYPLHLIRLVAPTTTPQRLAKLTQDAGGFIYLISRTGVTGTGGLDYAKVEQHAAAVKQLCALPVCIGFGINTVADVQALAPVADGVILGSALMHLIAAAPPQTDLPALMADKIAALRRALDEQVGNT